MDARGTGEQIGRVARGRAAELIDSVTVGRVLKNDCDAHRYRRSMVTR